MRKMLFTAAVLAAFTFTGCSETTSDAEGTLATEQHEGMDMSRMQQMPQSEEAVAAPDYAHVAEPVKTQTAKLVDAYLQLKEALVQSDAAAAQSAAQNVVAVAEAMPVATLTTDEKAFAEEQVAAVKASASQIAGATEVGAQRAMLAPLSKATFVMAKAFNANQDKLYYQFCPMANNNEGAYWVSNTEEIRNPYMGERMLTCGSNEEVLD